MGTGSKLVLTTVCNDGYVRLTKVMLYSFLKHNPWFDGDIVIIHDNGTECGLSIESKKELLSLGYPIEFHIADIEEYRSTFEHFRGHLPKNLNSSFYKLEALDFDEYDKILAVDGDMLFLKNIRTLFENTTEDFAVCEERGIYEVKGEYLTSLPNNNIRRDWQYFNGGLLFCQGSYLREHHDLKSSLLHLASTLDMTMRETYSPLEYKWVEQDVLNVYFHDIASKDVYLLSNEYNMSKRNFFDGQNMHLLNDVSILHYLAEKPFQNTQDNIFYKEINQIWLNAEKEMKNKVKIVGITLTYNEAEKVPYVMPYYERMGIDKLVVYDNGSTDNTVELLSQYSFVEIRHFETDGEFSNIKHEEIKNHYWKEFKDSYDWVMLTDFDEVIYCEGDLKEKLLDTDGTVFQKTMLNVFSEHYPSLDTEKYVHKNCDGMSPWIYGIDFFLPHVMGNKTLLFNIKEIEDINYGFAAHTASPVGNVKYFTDNDIFAFHLKYIDKDYILRKSEENHQRQIVKGNKGSSRPEYLRHINNLNNIYIGMKKNEINSLEEYNQSLINGQYYPIKLVLFTAIDNVNDIKQLSYSINEKLLGEKDIFLNYVIVKNDNSLNNDEIFGLLGNLKWRTFIYDKDNIYNVIERYRSACGDFWTMIVDKDEIIHANLRFLLRKALFTIKDKRVICLNYEDKDNRIYKKQLGGTNNLIFRSELVKNNELRYSPEDIIYEDEVCPDNNKVSAFKNMTRTQEDFGWDYGRLEKGEVTLKIESEWERIPLVYSIPTDVKRQIFEIIENSYKNNNLL